MRAYKVLIIEDELKIARFVELELKYEGYDVEKSNDGKVGLIMALKDKYDIILLDIMLPSMNGIEVLRRLRESCDTPVIMLTAKDEVMDKVIGLDMGANDYVTKPFAIEELLARIRAILKTTKIRKESLEILQINKLKMDLKKYVVSYDDKIIDLTKREFDLLQYLIENKNIVLTREKIVEKVWGYDYLGDTNIVDVYIRYLRSKIDEKYKIKLINTVRGVGYLLKDEI
ncbi:DNA-binding response regulator, OmpR family, contains REC and winged-helix (wHTH) domain [Clostridium acidisoli DSM 12555]|jgi:DNA-binding response OmpR family regulator|uniref:Stage 0 sporulation protein A homolog n=1 Tax=Clostridium acidisoli DSM 12555 TaxID=1121291 RepID=A0A1W1XPB8_9CLOT|nr:response regulator transcription factor [Clostridium acidisoli]SMC25695.1 DNA-binding response regulator, OmpR family, contains REC and winged-helix (wHTH) domain [Clostridium acidisoli DSM 12555]